MSSSLVSVKQCLTSTLDDLGMMCGFTHVGAYNSQEKISKRAALRIRNPVNGEELSQDRLMVVIANHRGFWEHFLQWIGTNLDEEKLKSLEHPLDEYTKSVILPKCYNVVKEKTGVDVIFGKLDTETRPFSVIVQAAGHLAGLAAYEPSLVWSVHPRYGLWIGFRAVIVFDIACDEVHDPPTLLSEGQRKEIADLAAENMAGLENGGCYDQLNLVQQRYVYDAVDECDKYTNEMIRWFHAASPQGRKSVLIRCVKKRGFWQE